jgi:zinc-ribbon domain
MTLMDCPECHRQVSSIARACPHCGYPLQQLASPSRSTNPIQTIEQRGKVWKAAQLLGAVILLLGIVWAVAGGERARVPSAILGVSGLVGFAAARIGAWWYHR